ncbi:hypothetical protein M3Y97_01039900 [Aphelenchoides bicaudatus]|nr:hypothetical protein M3Y97_01039900 [Aphelenchoides bicaudatus]
MTKEMFTNLQLTTFAIIGLSFFLQANAYSIRHALILVNDGDAELEPQPQNDYYFQRRTRREETTNVPQLLRSIMLTPNMRRIARNAGDVKRADFQRTGGAIIIG